MAPSMKACDRHDISQGSVATHVRCGRIFIDSIITNDSDNEIIKFENRLIFDEVKAYKIVPIFWATLYI